MRRDIERLFNNVEALTKEHFMAGAGVRTVLAISRQLGSGGSFIGQAVASRFGMHYADRDILHEAALTFGVEDAAIEPLEEQVEGFWGRVAHVFVRGSPEGPYPSLDLPMFDRADLFGLESRIIQELANRQDVVIVGRGAAHVLREHPGLISVFIHAPLTMRVDRVSETYHLGSAEAMALVLRSDRERRRFNEGLTGRGWTDASRYDLCLNTATLGLPASADLVLSFVEKRCNRETPLEK
jgi:CMP/dCMP kinase